MAEKKTLVVYYSRTGTTRKVAEAIAGALACDAEELIDMKDRSGPLGFVGGGKDATLKKRTTIGPVKRDPGSYDLVVVGTPVWAWTMSSAVRTYLTEQAGRLPAVAFFLTTGGTGMERTFQHMEELCGKPPVATLGLTSKEVQGNAHAGKVSEFVAKLRG